MEWRRLTQPEEPAFGRAMALYEASFPRHEQRLPDEQRAVLSHPEYHFSQLFDILRVSSTATSKHLNSQWDKLFCSSIHC